MTVKRIGDIRALKRAVATLALCSGLAVGSAALAQNSSDSWTQWMLNQSPQYYTVQMMGSPNRQDVARYVHQSGQMNNMAVVADVRNGQQWYSVVQGVYPDRNQAQQVINSNPGNWPKGYEPWPRSVSSIQKAYQERRVFSIVPSPSQQDRSDPPTQRSSQQPVPAQAPAPAPQATVYAGPSTPTQYGNGYVVTGSQAGSTPQSATHQAPAYMAAASQAQQAPAPNMNQESAYRYGHHGMATESNGKWFMGAGLGLTLPGRDGDDITSDVSKAGYSGVKFQTDDVGMGGKVFGGYRFNENLGFEVGYVHLGERESTFSTAPDNTTFTKTAASLHPLTAHGGYAEGVVTAPFRALSFYGKLGAFAWTGSTEISNNAGRTTTRDSNGVDLVYGAGAQYNLGAGYGTRVEWERFSVEDEDINLVTLGLEATFK
ncbi:MAG: outer membrane beta-barrel protein [Magnetococcales bacterium]|nr:outer membrane beta-barrel protein [Magnetococcales bacterium]